MEKSSSQKPVNMAGCSLSGLTLSIFLVVATLFCPLYAYAAECVIKIGDAGKTYTYTKRLEPGQSAEWAAVSQASSFIRSTSGPCRFEVFNNTNFRGHSVILGSNLSSRIRAGLDGIVRKDSGGGDTWRIRSIKMTRVVTDCTLSLGGDGVRMDYYGGNYETLPAMDRIGSFSGGDCQARIWNGVSYGVNDPHNRFKALHPVPHRPNAYDPGFRVRSMKIWDELGRCPAIASDYGRCLPQIVLPRSIYALLSDDDDQDKDGLVDRLENDLAHAFRPIYVNHSTENATRVNVYEAVTGEKVMEPVTAYQVEPVRDGEIVIRFMKLWRHDRYDSVLCGGHEGDSQLNTIYLKTYDDRSAPEYGRFWYAYKTTGGCESDLRWEKGDGSIRGVSFEKWKNESVPSNTANHLVIYFTKGKHHEYADGGWSGQADKNCPTIKAYINSRGEKSNPPLPKRIAVIRSPAGKGDRFDYNNVGNRAHNNGYLNDLGPLGFAGHHFWSGRHFYSEKAVAPCRDFK